jgi:hypothetical protein
MIIDQCRSQRQTFAKGELPQREGAGDEDRTRQALLLQIMRRLQHADDIMQALNRLSSAVYVMMILGVTDSPPTLSQLQQQLPQREGAGDEDRTRQALLLQIMRRLQHADVQRIPQPSLQRGLRDDDPGRDGFAANPQPATAAAGR